MTYPPQQPGRGQQPGQGGWGQPGYEQQSGYGRQQPGYGRFPQSEPHQQSGWEQQQPGWGRQPGWEQHSGFGGQPGPGGFGHAPKKSRTGLFIVIAIGAVVLLAGGGTGVYFAVSGGGSAEATADTFADRIQQQFHQPLSPPPLQELKAVTCKKSWETLEKRDDLVDGMFYDGLDQDTAKELRKINATAVRVAPAGETRDFTLKLTHPEQDESLTFRLELIRESGDWKACEGLSLEKQIEQM